MTLLFTQQQTVTQSSTVKHIALKVESYDLESKPAKAIGIRLDTGEKVAISIDAERVAKAQKNRSYNPPSIETFEGKKNKSQPNRRVHAGGIILFSAVFEQDGELSAGWATSLKHNSISFTDPHDNLILGDSETISYIHAQATFNSYVDNNGKSKGGVTLLLNNDKYGETIAPRLKERLTIGGKLAAPRLYHGEKALEQTRKYTEALFERGLGAVIRVKVEENGVYSVLPVMPMRTYGENQSTPAEWYEKRVLPVLGADNIIQLAKEGKIYSEVIPMLSATLNKNYRLSENLEENTIAGVRRLNQRYNFNTLNGVQRLYALSHVALYQHPDSDVVVVSSITADLMQDSFIGPIGAGYYLNTEFGVGTDELLIKHEQDVKTYKVPYQKPTEKVQNAVNSAVEKSEQAIAQQAIEEPVSTFDDDEIPF